MSIQKKLVTNAGIEVQANGIDGLVGVLYVFETREAARECFGDAVELVEVGPKEQ